MDPKLINTLIERWRPEMHTLHLLCGECTITLEDVQLQLGLPVDESALTASVQSANWGAVCYDILDAILDNNYRAYIIEMIQSYLMPDLSRNLVYLRWLLKLFYFKAADEFS
ncbi:hypothetical protein Goshw_021201 [Gossypium schwendimanii]|uniref:Aminotransferase-like plant mobile domain-containing protein n=1 Tax=Gossypium schwendimanii TaxID=34291 RepID=A0A7J9LH61_GOSSC|nr:hypothetical protein [Gossypium schwendimanii]